MLKQLIKRYADVFGNLTEQVWGNIPALKKWNCCATACVISELLVRTTLANFGEADFDENCDDLIHDFEFFYSVNVEECAASGASRLNVRLGWSVALQDVL